MAEEKNDAKRGCLACICLSTARQTHTSQSAGGKGRRRRYSVLTFKMTKPISTPTTAQSLGALLKSARDIMRKDKGLNGDLDRLPMLTWLMFLKFLDDLELQRDGESKLTTKKFKPPIDPPYPCRAWPPQPHGL